METFRCRQIRKPQHMPARQQQGLKRPHAQKAPAPPNVGFFTSSSSGRSSSKIIDQQD